MSNEVKTLFTGDESDLLKSFDNVGAGAKEMASDVGKESRRMASDTGGASKDIAGAVDASEGKFRGLGDAIGGSADVMEGFRTGNVAQMAMGMADLAGSMTALVIPALTALKGFLLTGLAPALTAISAHPLIAAFLIGGAIIAALFLLEKKFGVVSTAINFLKEHALDPLLDVLRTVGEVIGAGFSTGVDLARKSINLLISLVETGMNFIFTPYRAAAGFLNKIPGLGGAIPDFVTKPLKLPRLHSGGVMGGGEGLAILQAGERVIPRGGSGPATGGGGPTTIIVQLGDREIGRVVADALRQNRLIGVT